MKNSEKLNIRCDDANETSTTEQKIINNNEKLNMNVPMNITTDDNNNSDGRDELEHVRENVISEALMCCDDEKYMMETIIR